MVFSFLLLVENTNKEEVVFNVTIEYLKTLLFHTLIKEEGRYCLVSCICNQTNANSNAQQKYAKGTWNTAWRQKALSQNKHLICYQFQRSQELPNSLTSISKLMYSKCVLQKQKKNKKAPTKTQHKDIFILQLHLHDLLDKVSLLKIN